jgi:hypothetical protein
MKLGTEPSSFLTENECNLFSNQWYSYCTSTVKCGIPGMDANGPCPTQLLPTNYDSVKGKYTTLSKCNQMAGAWYGCNLCAKSGLSDIVACTKNAKPSDYKTQNDCSLAGYQYYSYCGENICEVKSTKPNYPCPSKVVSYFDSIYGKYTNLEDCNKNSGAWYGCNLCATRGLDEKNIVCK